MAKEPPGTRGLPWIGQTLPFVRDGAKFMTERVSQHGAVSVSRVMGRDVYIVAGPEALSAFLDEENIRRRGAFPPHVVKIFGKGAVNQLDGDAHRIRKRLVLSALSREAIASYLPNDVAVLRDRLGAWKRRGRVILADEGMSLSMAMILSDLTGVTDRLELDWFAEAYREVVDGLFGLPFDLPGFALHRALRRKAEAIERFLALVPERRKNPGSDGLSRLLAAEVDGQRLDDDTAAMELHHLLFAGSGTFGFFVGAAAALAADPSLRAPLEAAVEGLSDVPTAAELMACKPLLHFMFEVKRWTPILSMVPGKTKREVEIDGYTLPRGASVMWALHASHNVDRVSAFDDPKRFDPSRYDQGQHERHPHAHAPQGGGDPAHSHACAGIEFSGFLTMLFVVELLRSGVSFPEQDLTFETRGTPGPRDGMILTW